MIKLVAFDLDGTLTQHKTKLEKMNRSALTALGKKYKLLMVGAGQCMRIFNQMEFPIDIIGNYGMQESRYDEKSNTQVMLKDAVCPCDKASVSARAEQIRTKYGFTEYTGDSVEFHPSGCVTIALCGTRADQATKLAFDPDRSKRRKIYDEVCELFPEYNVFVGGSSSFDMAPKPYNKYYALDLYCREYGYAHNEVVFFGDDYGRGGNDESVYRSDFGFLCVDDYRTFAKIAEQLL